MLVNAVNAAPAIAPEWGLAEMDGSTHKDVYTYKDKLYNDLFTRTLGWNGGDGVFTVGLPGGHVYWTFNDSLAWLMLPHVRAVHAVSRVTP